MPKGVAHPQGDGGPKQQPAIANHLINWRTLRPRSGKTHVTDGPYTESKEVVGGLFIIEADTHDEALRIASMHPAATLGEEGGWVVELIPVDFYWSR
ncbi:YciI family protein [Paraburkholderia metrosideri]|uniref:YciI family protein n=1 Tax=Paraburkholderia metrosideri TaxID=580937 RepID=A0ABW9E694_9BURK